MSTQRTPRLQHLTSGAERLPLVVRARQLRREGVGWREIFKALGCSSTLLKWCALVEHITDDTQITAELLADQTFKNGRKPTIEFTSSEADIVQAAILETNQNSESGSVREALRRVSGLRPEVAGFISDRIARGQAPLTEALLNQVRISAPTTRAARGPRNAWLDYIQSPGSLQMFRDENGVTRLYQPGEQWTIDDGTKNFVCCVPIEKPGDKCWENFGVVVGRWQFLILGDHRTYFVPGFAHTARPRSSYRAEDLLATYQMGFMQHGVPPRVIMEKGISKSTLIAEAMKRLGVTLTHANSPHQKVVEAIFNNLWTRLSAEPGQVGRFMGEEEQINALIESCRRGATDPRKHFPMLDATLKALHAAIADWNAHTVKSDQYGEWVPQEWFAREAGRILRPLNPAEAWMFSPVVSDPLLVRRQDITTTWRVMDGWSMQFNFSAPWFHEYFGARVRLHYNPHQPECDAMVVLAEDFQGERAGTVLGGAAQINWHTRHNRRLLGIDEMEDVGAVNTRMNAQALRRSVVAIRTNGAAGAQAHEARNGIGQGARIESPGTDRMPATTERATQPAAPVRPARRVSTGVTEDEFERQARRLERDEERARRVGSLTVHIDD